MPLAPGHGMQFLLQNSMHRRSRGQHPAFSGRLGERDEVVAGASLSLKSFVKQQTWRPMLLSPSRLVGAKVEIINGKAMAVQQCRVDGSTVTSTELMTAAGRSSVQLTRLSYSGG